VAADETAAFLRGCRERAADAGRDAVLRDVATGAIRAPAAPPLPELLGMVCEALQPDETRRAGGVFYTPPAVAARIVDEALALLDGDPAGWRICDPACGGGAFLVAVARRLIQLGVAPAVVVGECLFGTDVDPVAVEVTRAALRLLAPGAEPGVEVADALIDDRVDVYDAVVGNPPFGNQLERETAHDEATAARLKQSFGPLAAAYTDTSTVFFALASRLTRPGGAFGMILPESVLAARDAGPLRTELATQASPRWIWRSVDNVFAANVRVCAPVFAKSTTVARVRRCAGADFAELPPVDADLAAHPTWSFLFADTMGIPEFHLDDAGTLGDYCDATADFRDQYYGLVGHVREHDGAAGLVPLITVGLIEPGRVLWGARPTRFARTGYLRPALDPAGLPPDLQVWAKARLVPKVVLATQSRVLEAAVDVDGAWLPSLPTITVTAHSASDRHIAAALTSPVATAVALRRVAGAALSHDAIKLSAKQVLALPAPKRGPDWDEAAAAMLDVAAASDEPAWRHALDRVADATCRAYGVDHAAELSEWWRNRLPRWRAGLSPDRTGPGSPGR
jgi:predicted RNA methylase